MSEHDAVTTPRAESERGQLDRHWAELLQELRVTQAGSQILTGFLLILPFQARFQELSAIEHLIYLVLVALSTLAVVLSLTPVILHRSTFRQGVRARLVAIAHVLLRLTLGAVALAVAGTMQLIFGMVLGVTAGAIAAGATLLVTAIIWVTLPVIARSGAPANVDQ